MLSCGIFSALAARIAPRKRGLLSGSPPPFLAAIEISLIRRVKILPRLASMAPFLCLIVAHFEWPDMRASFVYGGLSPRLSTGAAPFVQASRRRLAPGAGEEGVVGLERVGHEAAVLLGRDGAGRDAEDEVVL